MSVETPLGGVVLPGLLVLLDPAALTLRLSFFKMFLWGFFVSAIQMFSKTNA